MRFSVLAIKKGGLLFSLSHLSKHWNQRILLLAVVSDALLPRQFWGAAVLCGAGANRTSSSQQNTSQPCQGRNSADLAPALTHFFVGGGQETRCPSWFECQLLSSWHPELFPWQQLFVLGDEVMHLWSRWKGQWENVHYLKLLSSSKCLSITLKLGE